MLTLAQYLRAIEGVLVAMRHSRADAIRPAQRWAVFVVRCICRGGQGLAGAQGEGEGEDERSAALASSHGQPRKLFPTGPFLTDERRVRWLWP